MEQLGSAVLVLTTDNRPLDRGLSVAERNVDTSARRMRTTVDQHLAAAGKSMSRTGSTLSHNLTLPIVGLGVATADAAVKFQQSMEMIHTQAGATQGEVNRLTGSVLKLAQSGQVAQGPKQLADALFHLESVGLRGAKAMDALKVASEGAAVGNANLEETATALGAAWLVNIKGAGDLHHVMGVLNATVGAGNVRFGQLVEALGTGVLAASKQAGLSLQDVMGALAVFTDEGYAASSAAAQFGTALHFLTNPTSKASQALGDIGLKSDQLALDMHKPQGLLMALRDLQAHLDSTFPKGSGHALTIDQENQALGQYRQTLESTGLSGKKLADAVDKYKLKLQQFGSAAVAQEQTLGAIFPGGRGRVLEVLLNQLDRYNMKLGQINRTSGQFSQDVAATQHTAAFRIHAAWAQVQADAIQFGDVILPKLLKAGDTILKDGEAVANAFFKLPKGAQDAILTGGLIAAGLGPALKVLGLFSGVIGKAWQLAGFIGRLSGFAHGAGGAIDRMGLASQSVGTMEVGTLIAKTMVGGPAGAAGAEGAVARGAEGAGAADAAAAARAARVTTTVAGVSVAGVSGFAAMSHAQGGALNQLNALAHGVDPTAVLHLVGLPSLSDLLPKVKQRMNLTPAQIAGIGMGLDPASFGRVTANGALHLGAFGAHGQAIATSLGAAGGPTANASPARSGRDFMAMVDALVKLDSHKQGVTQTAAALDRLAASAAKAGDVRWRFGDRLGAEMLRARNVESLGVKKLIGELDTLPPAARADAAQSMVYMAQSFESQGRLPLGSTVKLVGQLLSNYQSVRDKGGEYFHSLMDDAGQVMDRLRAKIRTSTGQQRADAVAAYNQMRTQAGATLSHMESDLAERQDAMTAKIRSGTGDAAHVAGVNFAHFQTAVGDAMSSGVISTSQGADLIRKALNDTLKAFGAKQIAGVTSVTASSIAANVTQGTSSILGAVGIGGHAAGGLVQFGRPGERGRDSILANMAGRPIMVGPGEVAAILTGEQQAELHARTADVGGLGGFFHRFRTPHAQTRRFEAGGLVPGFRAGGFTQGAGAGGSVVLEPGVNMSVGQEPQILSDLRGLSSELHQVVYVISGYRSPSHSVAVGGFANDPHTRGQAADIGVGAPSLGSMFGVSAAQLQAAGLWRPFYPASAHEVNHVQLLGVGGGGGATGASGAPIVLVVPSLHAPAVSGSGTVADLVRAGLGKATGAANRYLNAHALLTGGGSNTANEALAHRMMLAAGWPESQWPALQALWTQESGFSTTAANPSSGAYGIPQSLPASKMASAGADYLTNPATQIRWGLGYIRGRYGSPAGAEAHEQANNWYSRGGYAITGPASTFGPPGEASGPTAYGGSDDRPGLALNPDGGGNWNDARAVALRGKWFDVALDGRHGRFQVIDKGPSAIGRRGPRKIDVTGRAAQQMGFRIGAGGSGFPTDDIATASMVGSASGSSAARHRKPPAAPRFHGFSPSPLSGLAAAARAWYAEHPTIGIDGPLPFETGDLQPISKTLSRILNLDGGQGGTLGDGDASKMGDLIQWFTGLWSSDLYPAPNFGSWNSPGDFVITQDPKTGAPVTPYISPNITTVAAELAQVLGYQNRMVGDIEGTLTLSRSLPAVIRRAIDRRKAQVKKITARIRENLQRIGRLKAQIKAERAKHKPDGGRIGSWGKEILGLERENMILGGSKSAVGTGGELGTIQTQLGGPAAGGALASVLGDGQSPTGLYQLLSTVQGWASQISAPGGDLAQQEMQAALYQHGLAGMIPGARQALANAQVTPTGSDNSQLLSLLEQQNAQLAQGLAVSQAQYKVLGDLPPFAGTFHSGGVIPGPLGQERMALVQAGERITKIGGDMPDTHLHFSGRDAWLKDLIDVRVEHKLRSVSRAAGRRLPSQGGGYLAGSPGS